MFSFSDSALGPMALLPNMFRKYGWNPAQRFYEAIRKELKSITGNPDITFAEVLTTKTRYKFNILKNERERERKKLR